MHERPQSQERFKPPTKYVCPVHKSFQVTVKKPDRPHITTCQVIRNTYHQCTACGATAKTLPTEGFIRKHHNPLFCNAPKPGRIETIHEKCGLELIEVTRDAYEK